MSNFLIKIIKIYQKTISLDSGFLVKSGIVRPSVCAFYPTCSEYAISSISKYGSLKGSYLGVKRILRCHPWQKNNIDPIP